DYSATKGAIHAFTKSLAQNLVEKKIRVNCVAPGPVWTPLNVADKPAEKVAEFGKNTPMERPAQPEEIAPAYVFFASLLSSGPSFTLAASFIRRSRTTRTPSMRKRRAKWLPAAIGSRCTSMGASATSKKLP